MVTYNFSKGRFSVNKEDDKSKFSIDRYLSEDSCGHLALKFLVEKCPKNNSYNVEITREDWYLDDSYQGDSEGVLGKFTVLKTTEKSSPINSDVIEFNCNSSEELLLAILRGGSPNFMALTRAVQLALIEESVEFLVERPVGGVTLSFSSNVKKLERKAPALHNSFNAYRFSVTAKNFIAKREKINFIILTFEGDDGVRIELKPLGKYLNFYKKIQPLVCNFNAKSLPSVYHEYIESKKTTDNKGNFGDTVLRNFINLGGELFNKEDVVNFLASCVKGVFTMTGTNSFSTLKSLKVCGNFNRESNTKEVFDVALNEGGTIKDVSSECVTKGTKV